MAESIQCYQCGTRMTLEELANNDGDCPECDVEIHLAEYLSKALDANQRLEDRLRLARRAMAAVLAQERIKAVAKRVLAGEIERIDFALSPANGEVAE